MKIAYMGARGGVDASVRTHVSARGRLRAGVGIAARVPARHRHHGHGLGARGSGPCRDGSCGARYPHDMAKTHGHIQFAALPFRFGSGGRPQVLLMTSRETRRWVIPKGWPIRGLKPREVAAREAFEEAGLLGRIIGKRPIGSYHYSKQINALEDILCSVDVFLFWVDGQAGAWPEKGQRELRWVAPVEAAAMVLEGGLGDILRRAVPGHFLPVARR